MALKVKMIVFLQSLESWVAKAVSKPFSVPNDDEDTWSEIITNEFDANAEAHDALLQALNDDDIARAIHCKSPSCHAGGDTQVKTAKIDLLRSQYKNFAMNEEESIDGMITKFTKITNGLTSLGNEIDNDKSEKGHTCSSTILKGQIYYIEGTQ